MKKSSMILLGYGLGYIIISILVATNFISLSSKDILPLSVASLIFFSGRILECWSETDHSFASTISFSLFRYDGFHTI